MNRLNLSTLPERAIWLKNPTPLLKKAIKTFVFIALIFFGWQLSNAQICPTPAALLPLNVTQVGGANATVCASGASSTELAVTVTGGIPNVGTAYAIDVNADNIDVFDLQDVYTGAGTSQTVGVSSFFSADFANGIYYALDIIANSLVTINTTTGITTLVGTGTSPIAGELWTAMAWDQSTGTMYGISTDVANSSTIHIIDLSTGVATPIVTTGIGQVLWLAIDNDGNAYVGDGITNSVFSIDLVTGANTLLGATGVSLTGFCQGADFDPLTGVLYTLAINSATNNSELHIVDTNTGAYTLLDVDGTGTLAYCGLGLLNTNTTAYNYSWSTGATTETISVSTPGTYTVTVSDFCGANAEATFTIFEQAEYTDDNCNSGNNISLDENGLAVLTPNGVLDGENGTCTDGYTVEIGNTGSNVADCSMIGQLFDVAVFDADGNMVCWGDDWEFEDKRPPSICCGDLTLSCTESNDPDDLTGPILGTKTYSVVGPVGIPDNDPNGVSILIEVPASCNMPIVDLDLAINVNHSFVGNLTGELVGPDGTTIQLFNRPGVPATPSGCAGNDLAVTFNNQSTLTANDFENTCGNLPAISGTYAPLQSLSAFNGTDPSGDWFLVLYDLEGNDIGSLISVDLIVESLFDDGGVTATDNCDTDVELTFTETDNTGCTTPGNFGTITRIWTATDNFGNTSTCEQTITLTRPELADIDCPLNHDGTAGNNAMVSCENYVALPNGHPDPATYGEPTFNGIDINGVCMFTTSYSDIEILDPNCPDARTYIRTWTYFDMCISDFLQCNQIIKVVDITDPVITCPASFTTGTTGTNASCMATVTLDPPTTLTDNCTASPTYDVTSSNGTPSMSGGVWQIAGLPLGTTTVTYTATDDCGNTSSCEFDITVEDDDPPPCVGTTNVTVNLNGATTNVPFTSFIDQNTLDVIDNCSVSTALIKRGNESWCPGDESTSFDISAPFFCCDVGQNVPVILQLTDAAGNTNECDVFVEVTDGSTQSITCPITADVPVQCDDLSPLDPPYAGVSQTVTAIPVNYIDENDVVSFVGYYDPANVTFTCEAEVFIYDTGTLTSLCGTGTITRTYELRNPAGIPTASCSFDFVVTNPPYQAGDVIFPPAMVTVDCADIGTLAEPQLNGLSCDHLGITAKDLVFDIGDPTVCFKIIREWDVVDCCVDPNNANVIVDNFTQEILVTDGTAPVITTCTADASVDEGEDVSFTFAATDCTDAYNGPFQVPAVSLTYTIDHSNGDPQSLGLASGLTAAPVTTGGSLFPVGTNTVTFIATDACGNESTCEVVITVVNVVDCNDVVAALPLTFPINVGGSPSGITLVATDPLIYTNGATAPAGTMLSLDESTQVPTFNFNCGMLVYTDPYGTNSPTQVDFFVHLPGISPACMSSALIRDGTAPTLSCPPSTSVEQGMTVDVSASATDFCTSTNDIKIDYEINQDSDQNNSIEFTGSGALGTAEPTGPTSNFFPVGVHTVTYTATDLYGNTSTCAIQITVNTNAPPMGNVSGVIGNEESGMLADVIVSPAQGMDIVMTDQDGSFNLNLPTLDNYDITPVKDDDHLNGVSTYDIVLLSKHILGIDSLDSPYKMIAGDVNKSEDLTTLDMILLRKVILFIDTEFQTNTSWRFVDANYIFNNPSNPLIESFPETYPINGLNSDMNDIDFIAVKTGDLNCSATVNLNDSGDDRNFEGQLKLRVEEQEMRAGETYMIDVKANDFNEILGYQFTLGFDENTIELLDVLEGDLPGLTDNNFNLQGIAQGAITTSWNHQTAISLEDNAILFTLEVKAKQDMSVSELFNISSRYTAAEAYKEVETNVDLMDVVFEYQGTSGEILEADGFALFQNRPNPFKDETLISFNLPETGFASLKIYDLSGKTLFRISGDYDKGYNELNIDRSELSESGVLYYELSTAKHTAVQKMIVID